MVGAAPDSSRLIMAQKAGRIPTVDTQLVASPLDRLAPLLCKVAGIGCVSKLNTYRGVVAVADMPAKAILGHRVVDPSHRLMATAARISPPLLPLARASRSPRARASIFITPSITAMVRGMMP